MDQQQTQQTEQIIAEMLEFLETSSEDEHDLEQPTKDMNNEADTFIQKDSNDNLLSEIITNNMKVKRELNKLRQEVASSNSKDNTTNHETENPTSDKIEPKTLFSSKLDYSDWQFKLENHCRRSYNNIYTQEVYKAIYQNTSGHPSNSTPDYYQAAQNYVLYGKHFLDFPKNIQVLLNDKFYQNSVTESSNFMPNFSSGLYAKPNNTIMPNVAIPGISGPSTTAYYQILNNMQAQTRSTLATNPANSTAYGIFMGNKVTYVAATPTTPTIIYNQQSKTATNFVSNSLANAALATSPAILYTNPFLNTTTTQQYLTQFLSAAALTSNSIQSTTVSANTGAGSVYERLIYAQMLQQQLYQTQQAATTTAMLQNKYRIVNQVARQAASVTNANSNGSSPQQMSTASLPCSSNGATFNSCYRQARSTSPRELAGVKPLASIAVAAAEPSDNSKISSA